MTINSEASNTLAIIGGSTVAAIEGCEVCGEERAATPFGELRSPIRLYQRKGVKFYFLSRHGEGHSISPSDINYRANIFALKTLGVTHVISVSAVGSLCEDMSPGNIVFVDQYIDWTRGPRKRSFYDAGLVGHASGARAGDQNLRMALAAICSELGILNHCSGTYLCIEGPQFSSRAESLLFRNFSASVVGMTNLPEAYLALEAGIAYQSMCMVTDYDAWKEETADLNSILQVLEKNRGNFQRVLAKFLERWAALSLPRCKGQEQAFFTSPQSVSAAQQEILKVLFA